MKKLLLIAAFVFCSTGHAAPIVLNFDKVPVLDFVNAVYGDILKVNYAVDPSLLNLQETVTVHFRDSNQEQVARYVSGLLDSLGIESVDMRGHTLIRKKSELAGKDVYVFRPKYRTASYVLDLISGFFPSLPARNRRDVNIGTGVDPSSKASASFNLSDAKSSGTVDAASVSMTDVDAVVFEGKPDEIDRLKKFLALVDTPVGEVLIKAIVYEVGGTRKEGNALGLAVNILGGRLGLSLGKSQAGDSLSFKSTSIEAVYSALSADSRFRVITSPSIRVKSGAHGLISVGQDVPVLGSVSYNTQGGAVQSVTMKPSGVILDLKPNVTEAGVDLTVKQQISSFVPTTTGVNSTPTLIKRELSTTVGTSHDEIVILGGLDERKSNDVNSGLPFLPSWMGSRSADDSKTEILLVLQVQKI